MNSVNIVGNLTKSPDLKYTPAGTAVVNLSIAVNEYYKEEQTTSFFNVVVFGKSAENCNSFLSKGNKIGITGKLKQERWKKEGKTYSRVVIIAERIDFLTSKAKEEPEEAEEEFSI